MPRPELIKALREADGDGSEHNHRLFAAAAAQIEKDGETIGKLPRTADGVPVVPGMNAFIPGGERIVAWMNHEGCDVGLHLGENVVCAGVLLVGVDQGDDGALCTVRTDKGEEFDWVCEYLYSTRAAAEAARAKGGGE